MGKMLSMGDHFSKFGTSELSIPHFSKFGTFELSIDHFSKFGTSELSLEKFSMFGTFELSIGHFDKLGFFGTRGGVVVVRKSAYGKMEKSLGCNSSSDVGWGMLLMLSSDEKPED